jgi:flagellar protein FlbD
MVIALTRLNGEQMALNPDLIERVEVTPDTVITLRDGTKYVVAESLDELVERITEFRARILARSQQIVLTEMSEGDEQEAHSKGTVKARVRLIPGLGGSTLASLPGPEATEET